MADKIEYTIHSVSEELVPTTLEVKGEKSEASVKYLVVEAVSVDETMGHTFRVRGGDPEEYVVGGSLTVALTPGT